MQYTTTSAVRALRIQAYRTPEGKTIGRDPTASASGGFSDSLASAIRANMTATQISSNSPLVRLGGAGSSSSGRISEWVPNTDGINHIQTIDEASEVTAEQVGTLARAPMAMYEHDGILVISAITRNEMTTTPVWTYSEDDGVQQVSSIPWAEAGASGYSADGLLHMTPEAWEGCIDYTATSPDGPWEKHDYTSLVPHDYKNLKWGFSYLDESSGNEYMGFGNADHPGMVIKKGDDGEWELFTAPDDMYFPIGIQEIHSGENAGKTLVVSGTYGESHLHLVDEDGNAELIKSEDTWSFISVDEKLGVVYMAGEDGHVQWADLDDLSTWKECTYLKPSGYVDSVEKMGRMAVHPSTGTTMFTGLGSDGTAVYEARRDGDDIVMEEVLWLDGVGQWGVSLTAMGDDLYLGTAVQNGQAADLAPGVIYKLEAS